MACLTKVNHKCLSLWPSHGMMPRALPALKYPNANSVYECRWQRQRANWPERHSAFTRNVLRFFFFLSLFVLVELRTDDVAVHHSPVNVSQPQPMSRKHVQHNNNHVGPLRQKEFNNFLVTHYFTHISMPGQPELSQWHFGLVRFGFRSVK